ncbi:MAG: segregation and condensation protein A [Deltaproteobacteria bacterium]
MTYLVDLEAFHGPMDLLLYLIEKDEINIYDIPIARISDQYISYLQVSGVSDLDNLGDFLLMASYLLNLKSRMLLPRPPVEMIGEEAEEIDPREELVQRLLDYKRYKEAAVSLGLRQEGDLARIFYRNAGDELLGPEEIITDLGALLKAYRTVLHELSEEPSFEIRLEEISVEDKMEEITNRLAESAGGMIFQDLFLGIRYRREAYALFMALLELLRLQRVMASQAAVFGEIMIYLRGEQNVDEG